MIVEGYTEIHIGTDPKRTQIPVIRHNTLTHGYIPLVREVEAVAYTALGFMHLSFIFVNPYTSERAILQAKGCFKDAAINLTHSPIAGAAVAVVAMNSMYTCE